MHARFNLGAGKIGQTRAVVVVAQRIQNTMDVFGVEIGKFYSLKTPRGRAEILSINGLSQ